MMVALALGACTPEQDHAQCEVESIRLYPNTPPQVYDDLPSRYVITCMKEKGYWLEDNCGMWGLVNKATWPNCYRATGWRGWFTSKK